MAKTAVLLDTSVIGKMITLNDVLEDHSKDYYVTDMVMGELEAWNDKAGKDLEAALLSVQKEFDSIRKEESNHNYRQIREWVDLVEKEAKKEDHDSRVARLLYEGFKAPITIVFKKRTKHFEKYFREMKFWYAMVLDEYNLNIDVSTGSARIARKGTRKQGKQYGISGELDLSNNFRDYDLIIRELEAKQEEIKDKYKAFIEGMKIRGHFLMEKNQEYVIKDHPTDDKILDYGKVTAKTAVKAVYDKWKDSGRKLVNHKPVVERFLDDVRAHLVEAFSELGKPKGYGWWGRTWTSLINKEVGQARRYTYGRLDDGKKYVPENNVECDCNLVSVARHFNSIKRGYKEVQVRTNDTDIVTMVWLCDAEYAPKTHIMECNNV